MGKWLELGVLISIAPDFFVNINYVFLSTSVRETVLNLG